MPNVKSSFGLEIGSEQVAKWVGARHQLSFEDEGPRQQKWADQFLAEWVDRYLEARADQPPRYLVCEHWSHIFVGRREEPVRWVYQVGGKNEGLIAAQVQQMGQWVPLDQSAREDLKQSLHDNGLPGDHESGEWGTELVAAIPAWARSDDKELGELKPFTVLGSHENTGCFFVLHVEATNSLQAFGAAAAELLAADQDGDALFYIALPGHIDVEKSGMALPGEGVVSYRTVLEQPDVFGEHAVHADDPAEPAPKA